MNWWRRRGWEQRMNAELRFHIESHVQDYIAEGMMPDEAARRVKQEFGALELAKDECRDEKPAAWFDGMARDVRYALRSLRKSPGFTAAAITTLALGIGANTAIFQLIDAVRLRTLPVPNPQSLVTVQLADRTGWRGGQNGAFPALTNPQWERLRDTQPGAFSGLLAWSENVFGLDANNPAHTAMGLFVSGSFFHVLGVHPLMGRVFSAGEDKRGCGVSGAVISYAFWQREFGGNPAVIGKTLTLNYQPVEIIGVTPAAFTGLDVGIAYDVAVPICSQAVLWSEGNWLDKGTVWWLNVIGRLKPGENVTNANAQLRTTSASLFQTTLPADYPPINVKDYLKFKLIERGVRTIAAPAPGDFGLRPRHCLRQSSKPHSGARRVARTRVCGADGYRRIPAPFDPSIDGGKSPTGHRWSDRRGSARTRFEPAPGLDARWRRQLAVSRSSTGCAITRVCRWAGNSDLYFVWIGPCAPRFACWCERCFKISGPLAIG
jgi:hypothetical protein